MAQAFAPMKYFQKNSQRISQKYKNEWLAISGTRVEASSKSYSEIADFADGFSKTTIIVKIPKNPNLAHFY